MESGSLASLFAFIGLALLTVFAVVALTFPQTSATDLQED